MMDREHRDSPNASAPVAGDGAEANVQPEPCGGVTSPSTRANRIRLQADPKAAARAHPRFSSKLVDLAEIVRSDHGGAGEQ